MGDWRIHIHGLKQRIDQFGDFYSSALLPLLLADPFKAIDVLGQTCCSVFQEHLSLFLGELIDVSLPNGSAIIGTNNSDLAKVHIAVIIPKRTEIVLMEKKKRHESAVRVPTHDLRFGSSLILGLYWLQGTIAVGETGHP
jgi:hypothetical protein